MQSSAEQLGNKYIFSWKPNPADLAAVTFDANRIRKQIRETVAACKKHNCVLEMVMKDTHTCNSEPSRFDQWVNIALECANEW